jgi:hypothetical protein
LYLSASSLPLCASNAALSTSEPSISEYQVKALYLYYFAKFVDWPATTFASKTAPIVIGIIGNDAFSNLVIEATRNKAIQEHPVVVRRLKWSDNIRSCNIVFVDIYESKGFVQFSGVLQSSSILTVTEMEESQQNKGIMNLFIEGGRVQFEIDAAAAEKAQLRISSKLLRMARKITGIHTGKKE